ncbi:hypothetical protein [Marinobacterium maritimum]
MNKRIIKKQTLIFLLIFSLVIIAIVFLSKSNVDYQSQQGLEPSQLTELLEMASKSQPNPDPYISSEVKPSDPLYPGLLAIQLNQTADDLLPLAETRNSDAMYWLASSMSGMELINGEDGALFQQAAELGNPYAAMRLTPILSVSITCNEARLGITICDDEWSEKALKLLKARTEMGDIKSEYYYYKARIALGNYSPSNLKIIDIATRGAKEHYYRPLYDLILHYYIENRSKKVSNENLKATESLIKMMINNNYIPAIRFSRGKRLYTSLSPEWREIVKKKYVELGLHYSLVTEFLDNISDRKASTINLSLIYRNLYILKEVYGIDYYHRLDREIKLFEKDPIRLAAEKEAESIIERIHFPIYIDEQHPPH